MTPDPFSLDFDRLEEGAKLTSRGRTITEADVVSFSALTGDWHPQHADADWAADGPFGERIAHGMLVLSYALGLLPIDPERVVALRGIRNVVFKRPVAIGSTIRVEVEVSSKKPLDEAHGLVELNLRVRDGDGRLVARAVLEALWRREPRAAAPTPPANGASAEQRLQPPAAEVVAAGDGELSPLDHGRVLI